jgi:hypothetical protein
VVLSWISGDFGVAITISVQFALDPSCRPGNTYADLLSVTLMITMWC